MHGSKAMEGKKVHAMVAQGSRARKEQKATSCRHKDKVNTVVQMRDDEIRALFETVGTYGTS